MADNAIIKKLHDELDWQIDHMKFDDAAIIDLTVTKHVSKAEHVDLMRLDSEFIPYHEVWEIESRTLTVDRDHGDGVQRISQEDLT